MSREAVMQIIERAAADPEFRTLLATSPVEALDGYDLTIEEAAGFHRIEDTPGETRLDARTAHA